MAVEAGTRIVACGPLETYTYKGKPRTHLDLRTFSLIARQGPPPAPATLFQQDATAGAGPGSAVSAF